MESLNSSFVINQFSRGKTITNEVVASKNNNEISRVSSVCMKLDGLQHDLSELIHILHVTERLSVKEIIQQDIQLILSKIESLEDLSRNQDETNISWSRVAALKHSKSKYRKQKTSDPLHLTSNRYNLLNNDANIEDNTPAQAVSLNVNKPTTNHVRKLKTTNCKKKKVINSVHKVLVLGDSHARGRAAEVKLRLNSEYEVMGFTNPGSTMKAIKESAKGKIEELTKKDIVVLWVGSNDVAKNSSVVGMKHIHDLVINATHTNVIQLSVPHRRDLVKESCVNREVKVFNTNLRNRLKCLKNVEMMER